MKMLKISFERRIADVVDVILPDEFDRRQISQGEDWISWCLPSGERACSPSHAGLT